MLARRNLSKKRIIVLTGALVLVWLVIGFVVYKGFFSKKGIPAPVIVFTPINIDTPLAQPDTPEVVGVEILRDPKLVNLMLYGEVPLEVKVLGREDPFSLINP